MKKVLKYLFIFIIPFTFITNVNASTNTFDRKELENYGIKKNIDVKSKLKYILNTKAVDASEKVYDFADLLTDEEEQELKLRIDKFIEDTNMDMVIVTDSFSYSYDKKNEEYADDFYDYNDFGLGFEYNSGVLLLRNANPADPYYHMSTTGSAQLYLSDSRIDYILDTIYYDIHSGYYLSGFTKFIDLTENYINEGLPETASNYYLDENGNMHRLKGKYYPPIGLGLILGLISAGITIAIMVAKNKMVKKATRAEEYLDKGTVDITTREDRFLRTHTTSYRISSSSGGGGGHSGGGHSFHSGSSGFSHGGGGRHG